MNDSSIPSRPAGRELTLEAEASGFVVPAIIGEVGERAAKRYLEFFAAHIRNPNTRSAYTNGGYF